MLDARLRGHDESVSGYLTNAIASNFGNDSGCLDKCW